MLWTVVSKIISVYIFTGCVCTMLGVSVMCIVSVKHLGNSLADTLNRYFKAMGFVEMMFKVFAWPVCMFYGIQYANEKLSDEALRGIDAMDSVCSDVDKVLNGN